MKLRLRGECGPVNCPSSGDRSISWATGKLLRRAIEADRFMSLILYGPPGSGKTALAHLIAERSSAHFVPLNAVTAGRCRHQKGDPGSGGRARARAARRTLLFIDEIHRFTKVQQDALLPDVERGVITLIGASTSNPFFAIIPALSSRSQIFEFKPLSDDDIQVLCPARCCRTGNGGWATSMSNLHRTLWTSFVPGRTEMRAAH